MAVMRVLISVCVLVLLRMQLGEVVDQVWTGYRQQCKEDQDGRERTETHAFDAHVFPPESAVYPERLWMRLHRPGTGSQCHVSLRSITLLTAKSSVSLLRQQALSSAAFLRVGTSNRAVVYTAAQLR